MRKLAVAISLCLFLLSVTGCGQSKEQKYANAVNSAQDRWGQKIANLATPNPTSSTFTRQDDALEGLIHDLKNIGDVPSKAKAAHSELIAALTRADQAIDDPHGNIAFAMKQVSVAIQNLNRSI